MPVGATGFNVYRGLTPQQLFRIASNQTPATTFTDTDLDPQTILPADPQFDHVNLYWRWELLPEAAVTVHSSTTVGNTALELTVNQYQSAVVRITRGHGAGQERQITGNTASVVTVDPAWTVEPDATSYFVIAENSWRTGNSGNSSPLTIDVPERIGSGVEISARAANASGDEAAYELSPLTRWVLGESGDLAADSAVPPAPTFALTVSQGTIELGGVAFTSLLNTTGIVAGTYSFHYYDEVNGVPTGLSAGVVAGDSTIRFSSTITAGVLVQIDQEIILTGATTSGATAVTRGVHSTAPADHPGTAPVYPLAEKVVIVPFIRNFFGSPASGEWNYSVELPDVRIASVGVVHDEFAGRRFRRGEPVYGHERLGAEDFGGRTVFVPDNRLPGCSDGSGAECYRRLPAVGGGYLCGVAGACVGIGRNAGGDPQRSALRDCAIRSGGCDFVCGSGVRFARV